jgi:hypothetical protein
MCVPTMRMTAMIGLMNENGMREEYEGNSVGTW